MIFDQKHQTNNNHLHSQHLIMKTRLGTVQIDAKNIYDFEKPLLGFEHQTQYALALMPGMPENTPFFVMQSIEDDHLCFVLLNNTLKNVQSVGQSKPLLLETDISFVAAILNIPRDELCYAMIVSKNDSMKNGISINTMAPIFFHEKTCKAWQIVLSNPIYNTCEPFV